MQVFINSCFTDEDKAFISPLSPGFLYGYGVFETIKVYEKRVMFLEEHYQRLTDSLAVMNQRMPYRFAEIAGICEKLLERNSLTNGFLKIICSKGAVGKTDTILLTGKKCYGQEYESGFKLCLASTRRNEFSKLCSIKSLNYAENIIEREAAYDHGFDEALFLNTKGNVCEGCISNIFWVKENQLFTPTVACGLLPGIARKKVLELCDSMGIPVFIGEFSLDEIKSADEIFLTNSLMDIMPVSAFENRQFHIKEWHMVHELINRYRLLYYQF